MTKFTMFAVSKMLELAALNPSYERYQFELIDGTLNIASIVVGTKDLPSRIVDIPVQPHHMEDAKYFMRMMGRPEGNKWYYTVGTKFSSLEARIIDTMMQVATSKPTPCLRLQFELKGNTALAISFVEVGTLNVVVFSKEVSFLPSQLPEVVFFLQAMTKKETSASNHWFMDIRFISTCV